MIRPSSYAEILAHPELLTEYAAECSIPEIGPVQPDPKTYAAMESAGVLRCFTAHQGKMVGFASLLLPILPHYSKRVATVESIFVTASARKTGVGRELMNAVEACAKEAGCVAILWSAPTGGKLERVLRAKRYRHTNAVFCKPL